MSIKYHCIFKIYTVYCVLNIIVYHKVYTVYCVLNVTVYYMVYTVYCDITYNYIVYSKHCILCIKYHCIFVEITKQDV